MAKRFKLDEVAKGHMPVTKVMQVQDLMTTAEADKIVQLNDEMKSIIENVSLSTDDRVKKFEQVLAEFRDVQNKIARNGGVDLIRNKWSEREKNECHEMIADVLIEMLKANQQQQPNPVQPQNIPSSEAAAIQQLEIPAKPLLTPVKKLEPEKDDAFGFMTPQEDTLDSPEVHDNFVELLKKEGLVIPDNDDKVAFPVVNDSVGGKPKAPKFAKSTFDKALNYLLSDDAKQPPRTDGVISAIYSTIKKSDEIDTVVKKYPNLNKIHMSASMPVKHLKWEELE
jgi:hypothetical protein